MAIALYAHTFFFFLPSLAMLETHHDIMELFAVQTSLLFQFQFQIAYRIRDRDNHLETGIQCF